MEGRWLAYYEQGASGKLTSMEDPSELCPVYALLPEFAPALHSITTDDTGRLWVEATDPNSVGGVVLQVLDRDGILLGEVPAPVRDARVAPYVRGNLLYLVTVDELDVQSIQVFEVQLDG
jgi:hypothetical protein